MLKNSVLNALKYNIVAVIRIKNTDLARVVTEAAIKNGLNFIELTLTIDNVFDLIKDLREKYRDIYIGAGTVLSSQDCEKAIKCGVDFIVSPCTDEDVINLCNNKEILCLPGAATATEINKCYKLGCGLVKIFPGDILSPSFIKSIKAPMPFVECMPSGGVNLKNIGEWFENGAYAISVGSALYSGINESNISEMSSRVQEYLQEINKYKVI